MTIPSIQQLERKQREEKENNVFSTSSRKEVMLVAHHLFKSCNNTDSFAECLKISWSWFKTRNTSFIFTLKNVIRKARKQYYDLVNEVQCIKSEVESFHVVVRTLIGIERSVEVSGKREMKINEKFSWSINEKYNNCLNY